jgi:hypothetical protein
MLARFRHVLIKNPLGPFLPEELNKVEQELGAALPALFTEFLTVAHGGTVEFIANAESEEVSLGMVFAVGPDKQGEYGNGTLLGELRKHRAEMGIPHQVLPFSQGGGDAWHYLDMTPEKGGSVVIYLEGLPEWTGRSDESAFVQVAPTFEAFLNALHVDESDAIGNLRNALAKGHKDWTAANLEYLQLCLPEWRQTYPELAADAESAVPA